MARSLSLSDAERFIEEGHFAKGSMLPKVEAAASFARSRAGREPDYRIEQSERRD